MTKEKMIEMLYKTLVDITSEEDAKKIIETVRNNHGKIIIVQDGKIIKQ